MSLAEGATPSQYHCALRRSENLKTIDILANTNHFRLKYDRHYALGDLERGYVTVKMLLIS